MAEWTALELTLYLTSFFGVLAAIYFGGSAALGIGPKEAFMRAVLTPHGLREWTKRELARQRRERSTKGSGDDHN